MTNHVHMLVSLQQGSNNTLSDIMRDMKKYTAMQLIKNIKENPRESRKEWMAAIFEKAGKYNSNNTNYQFWQQDNHPLILNDDGKYSKALEYIHQNPVTAGLVDDSLAYPWSSAKDYAAGKGIIPITML
jgi:putative transposase